MTKAAAHLIILLILICVSLIQSQDLTQFQANQCVSKTTCSECIQTSFCAWCMKANFGYGSRCFQQGLESSNECPDNEIYDPQNSRTSLFSTKLTRRDRSGSSNITQIFPQRVKLALRVDEIYRLQISYSQAEDYPVDLYYLMDLSKPTEDKQKLTHLAELLASTLQNITSDFRLGFGSFVNKVLMPNVSTASINSLECDDCAAFYGYRNLLSLSSDTHDFVTGVNYVVDKIKQCCNALDNLDAPGEGLNAIMQAVVCYDQINWRPQARRLLVFSTDSGFQFAEDKKLDGVINPNDGYCHLNFGGSYTRSMHQDYPSISQINLKMKQNKINVIFAVPSQEYEVCKNLSNHVEGSACAILSDDSTNVASLVEDEYNKITSSVVLADTSSSTVRISYFSSCLSGILLSQTNKCDGLKVGDVVDFSAEILLTRCPQNPSEWKQQFQIYPVGIMEALTIDLEMLCDCSCERQGITNSSLCFYHGTYKCGICECESQYFGRECELSI